MDIYGIGPAIRGAANIYLNQARGTGRTSVLIDCVASGDTVIFARAEEANRVRRLCREKGKDIRIVVCRADARGAVYDLARLTQGRVYFDHGWIEQFYISALDDAAAFVSEAQAKLARPYPSDPARPVPARYLDDDK